MLTMKGWTVIVGGQQGLLFRNGADGLIATRRKALRCTDIQPATVNFDPEAIEDDGSCEFFGVRHRPA